MHALQVGGPAVAMANVASALTVEIVVTAAVADVIAMAAAVPNAVIARSAASAPSVVSVHRVTAARALNVSAVKQVMRRNRLKPTAM